MSNSSLKLQCTKCDKKYKLINKLNCECGGILEIVGYDYKRVEYNQKPVKVWDYKDLLPVNETKNIITLAEGLTPLIRAKNLGSKIGLKNLYIKDETRNPTGSFKDRPTSIAISKALELGIKTVILASSGNAATSAAAYAAKGNLECILCIPEDTPVEKVTQARIYGAQINKIQGNYSNSYKKALEYAIKNEWFNVTSTYLNPYSVEGDKVIAYELFNELEAVPDYILVPIGAGPLLHGVFKGFEELRALGLVESLPKMVGVQSEGCCPIVESYEKNQKEVYSWSKTINTLASGINDPLVGYEKDGTFTLDTIYQSNGYAIKSDDKSTMKGLYSLAQNEGIFAEPAGAIGVAGVQQLLKKKRINPEDIVVILVTGHGLKNMKVFK